MNIVWINVLLTLEPISLSPIFEVAGKGGGENSLCSGTVPTLLFHWVFLFQ